MNNNRLIATVSGLCLWCFSQLVAAAGPNYTYAEMGYQHVDADKYDGNGVRFNISYGATDNIFVKMGYARLFVDATGLSGDIDVDRFNFGIGGHMPLTDKIDALGLVSYVDNEYSGAIPSEADDGYQVDLGVRAKLSKKAEVNATATYRHMGLTSAFGVADDDDTGFEVGTVIKMYKKFSFTGNVSYFDETEEVGVFAGVRLKL